jgi:cellulose synthase operon protein C
MIWRFPSWLGVLAWVATMAFGTVSLPAQQPSDAATRQYAAAAALQNKGEFELAADEWAKFVERYPGDPRGDRALHYLGICYLKAKKPELAQQCFQRVIKSYPKFDLLEGTYLYLGLTQYTLAQSGKPATFDAAAATFETLLKRFPQSKHVPQALFYRGECLYARGKKEEATRMYSELLAKYPDDKLVVDALYALGVSQEETGDFTAAGRSYEQFFSKFPDNPLATEVQMRRGETLLAGGKFQAAAERFAIAAGKPGYALADHATVRQAACLAQLKQYAEAAKLYASVPAKFPNSKEGIAASLAGGKCYYQAGDYAEAQKLLATALKAGGNTALEAAHWNARSLLKEQKPAEALAVVEKALPQANENPLRPQLLLDEADAVYDIADRRGEAIALYAALAAKYPQDSLAPQALYMAAFAALGKADYATAIDHATAFLAAHSDHELAADVTAIEAESKLQQGKLAEAEKLFAQVAQKYPDHADAESWKVRRGLALQMQQKHGETIATIQPLLKELKNPEALAEAQFLLGSSQVEKKNLAAAQKSLEAALAAAPQWRQADDTLLLLADVRFRLGQVEEAKSDLWKLIADFPKSRALDRAHYRLGEYLLAGGNTKDAQAAAAEYESVLKEWPEGPLAPYALYGLAWAKLNQGDNAGAEAAVDALAKKHAQHALLARARYVRGMARQQLEKYKPAVDDLQAFLAADPSPAEKSNAQYVLGLCQTSLKQHREAVATFETLLKDDPKGPLADKVSYELGWALKSQDQEKEAAEVFARLAKTYTDSPLAAEALYHVGEFAYKGGDFNKAVASYDAAVQKAGKSDIGEKAAHKLGWAYYRLDNFEEAQKAFGRQREAWPTGQLGADAAFMQGECLFKLKRYEQSISAFDAAKSPSTKDFQVLTLLHGAQAAAQLKQWEKSFELAGKCAEQFADSIYLPEALYERGWAAQNLGKLPVALATYEQVVAQSGGEPGARAQFMIGEIQFEQKKHEDAIKSFFKVAYGYSYPKWQAEADYEAARCFEVLGKKTQAVKQYQELIEKFPESDRVPVAKERIKALQ